MYQPTLTVRQVSVSLTEMAEWRSQSALIEWTEPFNRGYVPLTSHFECGFAVTPQITMITVPVYQGFAVMGKTLNICHICHISVCVWVGGCVYSATHSNCGNLYSTGIEQQWAG